MNDPLVAAAINDVFAFTQPTQRNKIQCKELSNSKKISPIYQKMIKENP